MSEVGTDAGAAQKLLVVDDNEDNRDLLARRLRRKGYAVDTAEDGPSCLEMIESGGYDLVLLDIMMPGMSGIDVLERLRSKYAQAELPVLMATAKSDSQDMIEALAKGANDYVTKPIDFPVVLARVQSQLKLRSEWSERSVSRTVLAVDGSLPVGTVLDERYEILSSIGEGGFAVVYKAKQLSTGQVVAVKLLRAHRIAAMSLASVELARFNREMKLIGKLTHPHIVRLIDSGSLSVRMGGEAPVTRDQGGRAGQIPATRGADSASDGSGADSGLVTVPYLVMEYLQGEPLSVLLRREGAFPVAEAIELLLPILSAVGSAHRAGVVHRDLKPPNILVERAAGGKLLPKVLDFGIARLVDDESSQQLTMDSGFIGTPEYMAPEQARGQTAVTASADQYALGVMLYECVTGRRPFKSDSFIELVHLISRAEFPPPREIVPEIEPAFEAVLLRAMAAEPERRFSSVESFGRALLPHATEAVRAQWASAFPLASDPPPPMPEADARTLGEAQTMQSLSPVRALPDSDAATTRDASVRPPARESTPRSAAPPARSGAAPSSRLQPVPLGVAFVLGVVVGAVVLRPGVGDAPPPSSPSRRVSDESTYRVVFEVEPPEAAITLDGHPVGAGTFLRRFPMDGTVHTLRVSAPGYAPATFSFRDAPPPDRVTLEPVRSP